MKIAVGRRINGITINPLEFLLDDDGVVMLFDREREAVDYLKEHGVSDKSIEWMEFIELDENSKVHQA